MSEPAQRKRAPGGGAKPKILGGGVSTSVYLSPEQRDWVRRPGGQERLRALIDAAIADEKRGEVKTVEP